MTLLTVLGLGIGEQTTPAVHALLQHVQRVIVPTQAQTALLRLPAEVAVETLDSFYTQTRDWNALPHMLAEALLNLAAASADLVVAVPGHPLVGNRVVQRLRLLARERGITVQVLGGRSLAEPVCEVLDTETDGLQVLDALALLADPVFPAATSPEEQSWSKLQGIGQWRPPMVPFPLQPAQPALICQVDERMAPALQTRLQARYPAEHALHLVRLGDEPGTLQTHMLTLAQLDQSLLHNALALFVPPLLIQHDAHDMQALAWVTARLLGPAGCPWDREQTHQSLRRYLLEETHETLEALDAEDWDGLGEELGDLLLQIVLHSEMARQAGRFDMGDVQAYITRKLIRRHPHVFGEVTVADSGEVLRNWDAIKVQERATKGTQRSSLLDGVPVSLPALAAAQLLGHKAANVGFDWPNVAGVWAKVEEELDEIRQALPEQRTEEFGDLLLVLARLGAWLEIDVEAALRQANTKFRRRFAACERLAQGRDLAQMTADELDQLWNQAKREELTG